MSYSTYSFSDVSFVISHPALGQYIANGEGLGTISISRSTDNSVHDIASDGSVMVSKIRARNGIVNVTIQQTSNLNKWLQKWFNYLETAPTSAWAETTVIVRAPMMGETTTCIGVSPQKPGDKPYQQQGQQVSWNLMSADVQMDAA